MSLPLNPHVRVTAHDTATAIACAFCGASADQPCVTRSGVSAMYPHQQRIRARYRQLIKAQTKFTPTKEKPMKITTAVKDQDHTVRTNLAIWWTELCATMVHKFELGDTCRVVLDTPLDCEWLFLDGDRVICRTTLSALDNQGTEYEWVLSVPTEVADEWEIKTRKLAADGFLVVVRDAASCRPVAQ